MRRVDKSKYVILYNLKKRHKEEIEETQRILTERRLRAIECKLIEMGYCK